MARQFTEDTLIVASHNQGKVLEIAALLAPYKMTVTSASACQLDEPVEDGDSYIANAAIKAKAAAITSGLPALSDDSGFEVMAIDGDPGLYSARWAGADKDFSVAMQHVHDAITASCKTDTSCRFVCALALCWPDGEIVTTQGIIDGHYVWPPRGNRGFGYDPMFIPDGYEQSFGEVDPEWKHAVSHRAIAFQQLIDLCFQDTPRQP